MSKRNADWEGLLQSVETAPWDSMKPVIDFAVDRLGNEALAEGFRWLQRYRNWPARKKYRGQWVWEWNRWGRRSGEYDPSSNPSLLPTGVVDLLSERRQRTSKHLTRALEWGACAVGDWLRGARAQPRPAAGAPPQPGGPHGHDDGWEAGVDW